MEYEGMLFLPDYSAKSVKFHFHTGHEKMPTITNVLASFKQMSGATLVASLDFPNPENPLHWHTLLWDREGIIKGLELNRQITERMQEVVEDFPEVYGPALLIRDKFWTEDEDNATTH